MKAFASKIEQVNIHTRSETLPENSLILLEWRRKITSTTSRGQLKTLCILFFLKNNCCLFLNNKEAHTFFCVVVNKERFSERDQIYFDRLNIYIAHNTKHQVSLCVSTPLNKTHDALTRVHCECFFFIYFSLSSFVEWKCKI